MGRRFCFRTSFKISNDMDGNDPLDREGVTEPHAADPNDPLDWDGIKLAFTKGDWSLARIGDAFGTTHSNISRRAKKDGWVREVGTKPLRGRRARGGAVSKTAQRRILKRLYRALDEKMKVLEERIAQAQQPGAPELSAADAERDARTLSALARLYAKLVELDDQAREGARKEQGSEPAPATRSADDADRLRRDLALRLQRLNSARDA